MSTLPLAFPRPQFALLPDAAGVRWYGNVYNAMEVSDGRDEYRVAVAVPTGLFTILKDVFNVQVDDDVLLSLDHEDERFVFSVMIAGAQLRDLWDYSEKSVPAWILSPTYRL